MKRIRHYLKVALFGVFLGVFLVFLQRNILRVDTGPFLHWYWIIAAAVIIGAAAFNIIYVARYQRKAKEALKLLDDGDARGYVEAMERLLQKARGKYLRRLLQLNLSAGYCHLKQYAKAIALLEPLPEERLLADAKMVRRLNLCVCYFHNGQVTKALTLYGESKEIFAPFRDSAFYGWNMAMLDMLAGAACGRYDEVRSMLEEAREKWDLPRYQEDYQFIQEQLDDAGK